jgi:hypothetical protein
LAAAGNALIFWRSRPELLARGFQAREFLVAVCGSAREVLGGAIRIECESSEGELSNYAAAALALFLNQLLTNPAKHGINGRGEGTVKVSLTRSPNEMALRVEDDDGAAFELSKMRRRAPASAGYGTGQTDRRKLHGRTRHGRVLHDTLPGRDPRMLSVGFPHGSHLAFAPGFLAAVSCCLRGPQSRDRRN